MTFESEEEIIEHKNDGQECDQCGEWLCHGTSLKTHKKREHTEIECMQCNVTFESEEEFIEHENDNQECDQCEEWLCYGISLEKT